MSEIFWDVSVPLSELEEEEQDYYAPWGGATGYARAMANRQIQQAGVTVPEDMEPEIHKTGPGVGMARWRWFG